jgi:hypothetical protein
VSKSWCEIPAKFAGFSAVKVYKTLTDSKPIPGNPARAAAFLSDCDNTHPSGQPR